MIVVSGTIAWEPEIWGDRGVHDVCVRRAGGGEGRKLGAGGLMENFVRLHCHWLF